VIYNFFFYIFEFCFVFERVSSRSTLDEAVVGDFEHEPLLENRLCEFSGDSLGADIAFLIAAIMSLKRKKAYDGQIQNLSGARLTIETQIMSIESASTHFAALSAMQEGARAMKSLNNNMYDFLMFDLLVKTVCGHP